MATMQTVQMADDRRALLTPREREILSGEADVNEDYYYAVVSRVRKKIQKLDEDVQILHENHPALYSELQAAIVVDESGETNEKDDE
ncbi:hypothetical protein [Haloplanus natans]|uniref:hypothetical protein n=1 Tax=Haloplanus natans TaxID=376171 RepID=UPI001FE211BF|nr:hypothetical protein [Haloplanus natans]